MPCQPKKDLRQPCTARADGTLPSFSEASQAVAAEYALAGRLSRCCLSPAGPQEHHERRGWLDARASPCSRETIELPLLSKLGLAKPYLGQHTIRPKACGDLLSTPRKAADRLSGPFLTIRSGPGGEPRNLDSIFLGLEA